MGAPIKCFNCVGSSPALLVRYAVTIVRVKTKTGVISPLNSNMTAQINEAMSVSSFLAIILLQTNKTNRKTTTKIKTFFFLGKRSKLFSHEEVCLVLGGHIKERDA